MNDNETPVQDSPKKDGYLSKVGETIQATANKIKRSIQGYRSQAEQHIALFGESGSGKTTLLTVFYGYQQDIKFQKEAGYRLLAADTTQGQELSSRYYQLSSNAIPPNKLYSKSYTFNIRLNGVAEEPATLVWHDYPGEWWTETKNGEEQEDKEKTFLALMASDVALFLVDGKKYKQDGDKYLKHLLSNFRDELCRLKKSPALRSRFPLTHFPRFWLICLSKADLLPDMTVEMFKKRVLAVANDELQEIKREIEGIIEKPEFFSLGENYLLLSAAEFDEQNETVTNMKKRKGVDLIAPIAFTLPIKQSLKWANIKASADSKTAFVTETLGQLVDSLSDLLKFVPIVGNAVGNVVGLFAKTLKDQARNLRMKQEEAIKKGCYLDAILLAFAIKLSTDGIEQTYLFREE